MNIEEDLKQIACDAWRAGQNITSRSATTTERTFISFEDWWHHYKIKIFGFGMFVNINDNG
jgi:hypothetical protein